MSARKILDMFENVDENVDTLRVLVFGYLKEDLTIEEIEEFITKFPRTKDAGEDFVEKLQKKLGDLKKLL